MTDITQKIHDAVAAGRIPAFAYDRVSTQEQAEKGLSLTYQNDVSRLYADRAGLAVVEYFTIAESAWKKAGRKTFNRMIDLAIEHGVRHLIFKSTDRLSRNYRDLERILSLIDNHGISIHFYQSGKVINKTSDHNDRMIIGIELVVAKHHSDKISHDIKAVYRYKAARGIPPYRFPMGYLYDKQNRVHVKDQATRDQVEYIFDAVDNRGMSVTALAEHLTERGYKTPTGRAWHPGSLHRMLVNPIYAGYFVHEGIEYDAHHEPYIDRATLEKRRAIMSLRYNQCRQGSRSFLFSRFLVAGATGRRLTGETKKERFTYYTHRRPDVSFTEYRVMELVDREIEAIQYSPGFAERVKDAFRARITVRLSEAAGSKGLITRRIHELEMRQGRVMDMMLDDDMDREAGKMKLAEIRGEITRLLEEQKRAHLDKDELIIESCEAIDYLQALPALYARGTPEEKAAVLRAAADSITIYDDHADVQWKRGFAEILHPDVMRHADTPEPVRKTVSMHASVDMFRTDLNRAVDRYIAARIAA